MADCSTLEDGLACHALGCDLVGTTLSGYTQDTAYLPQDRPNTALIGQLAARGVRVMGEGRIRTPQDAADCLRAGACCVTVGSAITRIEHITQWFAAALHTAPLAGELAAALVQGGVITARRQVPMAVDAAGFAAALDALVDGWPGPGRISVATTGYIDGGKVYPVNRSIISFWNGFPLEQLLRQRFDCPVTLFNDAQAAAWGEYCARRDMGAAGHPANL
eukprot:gene26981-32492_t